MSFGGAVGAMISSLKNNKRDRPSAYKKLKDNRTTYENRTVLHFDKKSSPEQLRRIREKVRREHKVAFYRKVLVFSIILILVILLIGFIKF